MEDGKEWPWVKINMTLWEAWEIKFISFTKFKILFTLYLGEIAPVEWEYPMKELIQGLRFIIRRYRNRISEDGTAKMSFKMYFFSFGHHIQC